jgi:hypothetical protein
MLKEAVAIGSRQSRQLVQALANQTSRPLDEARRVYESQFVLLDGQARIKTYLPIFAARQAREILSSH